MLNVFLLAFLFWALEVGLNISVSVFNVIGKAMGPLGLFIVLVISIFSVLLRFYFNFFKTAAAICYYDSAKQTAG